MRSSLVLPLHPAHALSRASPLKRERERETPASLAKHSCANRCPQPESCGHCSRSLPVSFNVSHACGGELLPLSR